MITLTSPSMSAQDASFKVSRGQKGFTGGALGAGLGFGFVGLGAGLGFGSVGLGDAQVPQAVVNVAKRSKERIRMVEGSLLLVVMAELLAWWWSDDSRV